MNRMLKKGDMVSLATGLTRPSREEAEAAVRTLLRWSGDDPAREGLVGTPDRVVRSYEEFFAGYDSDPRDMLLRTFEEIDGYDEVVTCATSASNPLRAPHGTDHRQGSCRLSARQARRWHQQARARGRRLRPPPADPGEVDGADRQHAAGGSATARRCRRHRGGRTSA